MDLSSQVHAPGKSPPVPTKQETIWAQDSNWMVGRREKSASAKNVKFVSQYLLKIWVLNRLAPELFFLILAPPIYKMWIIQKPNMLELWNKLYFEEKKTESIYHV